MLSGPMRINSVCVQCGKDRTAEVPPGLVVHIQSFDNLPEVQLPQTCPPCACGACVVRLELPDGARVPGRTGPAS